MARRKGSRNRGYFYRRNRGWFTKDSAGHYVALTDETGNRLRDRHLTKDLIEAAYGRYLKTLEFSAVTAYELTQFYLAEIEHGAASTFDTRANMLYDFCTGYGQKWRKSKRRPKETDKLHAGFADRPAERVAQVEVIEWLDKHAGWGKGTRRLALQALKRVYNFGIEKKLIGVNPLRGMKIPRPGARVTCISPEQETELLVVANSRLAEAIRILIRTGMRPSEFAQITSRHIHDLGDRLEIKFTPEEIKTRKARIVRVADPEIIELIRKQKKEGVWFRNKVGKPWLAKSLSRAFLRAKGLAAKRIPFDKDCCLYSCRHTFAKRVLTGYWRSGKPISIEVLSQLMGNTPEVCRANYLQWSESYTAPLWDAVC
jgi:integrase